MKTLKRLYLFLISLFAPRPLAANEGESTVLDARAVLADLLGLPADADDAAIAAGVQALKEAANEDEPDPEAANTRFREGCKALGISEDSTPEEFHNAIIALPTAANEVETEKKKLVDEVANERKLRAAALLDLAVNEGRVMVSKRTAWNDRFAQDFAATEKALANEAVKLPGGGKGATGDLGGRKQVIANAQERRAQVHTAVNEVMAKEKISYDEAFRKVKADKQYAGLFEAMTKPGE